jgi:hypothetical protein
MAIMAIPEEQIADSSLSAYDSARSTVKGAPLTPEELSKTDAYWRLQRSRPRDDLLARQSSSQTAAEAGAH